MTDGGLHMMNEKRPEAINGFLVVRLPEMNRDEEGRGVFPSVTPCLGTVCYGGIDRMPWFEIDELFYGSGLPENIAHARKLIDETNSDHSGIWLCRDFDLAIELLRFSNSVYSANELIAVWSETLSELKGIIEFDTSRVEWLGYDVHAVGQQSLLRDGLFAVPTAFPGWVGVLNTSGLFSSPDVAMEYADAYQEAASKDQVEELGDALLIPGHGIEAIAIGRVILPSS